MKYNLKKVLIGEVCEVSSGLSKDKSFFGKGFPFLSFKTVFNNYFVPDVLNDLVQSSECERHKCSIKYGDIFLTRTSETQNELGMSSVALKDYPNATFNGFTKRLRIKPEFKSNIFPGYLGYYFRSPYFRSVINSMSTLTTRASLNNEMINRLPLLFPDYDAQIKIFQMLSSIDKKIELNNKINDNLLKQANEVFDSYFVNYSRFNGIMPDSFVEKKLCDIADFQNGYAFNSKELLNTPEPNCYHVFKQGHINRGGGFNTDGTKSWYPKDKCSRLSKYILKKGDLLMAMTDMKDNVAILGNTAIMPVDNQYIVNQRVGLIRGKGLYSIDYPYLFLLTNSKTFLSDLRKRANSGVQVNLSSEEIKKSILMLAPDDINMEFNSVVKPMFELMISNQIEKKRLSELRDTILPKLMSGEIDVDSIEL